MPRSRICVLLLAGAGTAGCYDGANTGSADTDVGDSDGTSSADTTGIDTDDPDDPDDEPQDVPEGSVPTPLVARLNHQQYANAIEDVLGVALTEDELGLIPKDISVGSAYSTRVQGQFFNAQYVLGYAYVARSLVDRIGPQPLLADHAGCAVADPGCIETFVNTLGRRLHRRPLDDDQRATYVDLAAAIADDPDATDDDVVTGLAEAMLQSPFFLYRLEREVLGEPSAVYKVDGYELASRLSFFLWQSVPDDALLDFAAGPQGDGVYDETELSAQVERMVGDTRFARSRRQFWADYTLAGVAGFTSASPEVGDELRESLLATLDRVSGVDGPAQSLAALFDGTELVMTPAVAEIAGATPQGDGLEVYATADAQHRRGVLTHPGFLAALGTTSFVGRGLFMTERLLCQHILPPPSDTDTANAIMDTAMQTEELTPRGASEFRFGLEPVCLTCHTQFEPIAYAFERYDMLGAYGLTDEQGRELFSDGNLPPFLERPEIPFADASELFAGLADADTTYRCLVENMMEYATGWPSAMAEDSIDAGQQTFDAQGRTFDALIHAVADNQQLTFKRSAEEEEGS